MTYFCYLLPDLVEPQMLKLFDKAASVVLANITMDVFDDLDEFEVNLLPLPSCFWPTKLCNSLLNLYVLHTLFVITFLFKNMKTLLYDNTMLEFTCNVNFLQLFFCGIVTFLYSFI